MSYQVFARKYRPQRFEDVVGQEHITRTLRNAIEQNRLAHAYLLVGPRGTGKTSTARIVAKALNCSGGPSADFDPDEDICREIAEGRCMDVLEIDGASNNSVDQIRELRDNVRFAPSRGKYKVYIIDEVHMLSTAAFNALLKTLEEPPEHVKFIFATTEPQKVLPTILSRCQRFDLRRIPAQLIAEHLQFIAKNEGLTLDPEAAEAIATGADGGLRDAESMLDQLVAFCGDQIAEADVLGVFGFPGAQTIADLAGAVIGERIAEALSIVHEQSDSGKDLLKLLGDLIGHLRNVLVFQVDPDGVSQELGGSQRMALEAHAAALDPNRVLDLIDSLATAEGRIKWAANKKLHLEIAIIKAVQLLQRVTLDEVIHTLTDIREGKEPAGTGQRTRPPAAAQTSPSPGAVKAAGRKTAPAPRTAETAPAFRLKDVMTAEIAASKQAPEKAALKDPEPAADIEKASPSPPASRAPQMSSVQIEQLWADLLKGTRSKLALHGFLTHARILECDGLHVLLGFPPEQRLLMESLQKSEKTKQLTAALVEILGGEASFETVIREGVLPMAVPQDIAEETMADDPLAEWREDPLIKEALALFKAEIAPQSN